MRSPPEANARWWIATSGRDAKKLRAYGAIIYQRARRTRSTLQAIAFLMTLLVASTAAAQPEDHFTKGNQEYAAGRFTEAIDQYEALVQSKEWSASLFYNLGNARFRTGDFGRAILNYERALALDPDHPEAKANLRIARDEARALVLAQPRAEMYLGLLSLNQYTVAAATAFWIAAFFAVASLFTKRRRPTALMSILSFAVCAVCGFVIYTLENGSAGRGVAVVIDKQVEARVATAETANRVLALPAGSEIRIESRRGDWVYATLPSNLRGWIPAKSAELVRR